MKRKLIFALSAIIALSSCQKSEEGLGESQAVSFNSTINGHTSRAGELYFDNGDAISVFAKDGETLYKENVKYTYGEDKFTSETPIKYESASQNLAFSAVYPYSETMGEEFTFAVAEDQSSNEAYSASDLMSATTQAIHSKTPTLSFSHRLTKIQVNIVSSDVDTSDAVVTLAAKNSVECNLAEGSFAGVGSDVTITANETLEDEYSAIIAPQTIEIGTELINVVVNGTSYTWSANSDIELTSGAMYTCELTLLNGEITLTGMIELWGEGGELEGGAHHDEETFKELTIDLYSMSATDIKVDVRRGDYDGNYYVGLTTMDIYRGDPEEFALALINYEIENFGTDFSKADNIWVFDEDQRISLDKGWNIEAETEYAIVAMGVSPEGELATNVAYTSAKTLAVTIAGSLDVSVVDTTADDIIIDVVPSSEIKNYTFGAIKTKDYEDVNKFNGDPQFVAQNIVAALKNNNIDISAPNNFIVYNGEARVNVGKPWQLEASGDYTVFVFGIDTAGNITSQVETVEARTKDDDLGEIDGTLEVTIAEVSNFDISVNVEATGNVGYYYLAPYFKEDFERDFNGDVEALAKAMIDKELNFWGTNLGNVDNMWIFDKSINNYSLGDRYAWVITPEFDYMVLAFGVTPTGEITTNIAVAETYTGIDKTNTSEGSPEYNAWIGDWTLTSWDSYKGEQVVYDIKIEKHNVDESFLVTGWGSSSVRNTLPIIAKFDNNYNFLNMRGMQRIANDGDELYDYRTAAVGSISTDPDENNRHVINIEFDVITGEIKEDGYAWVITTMGNLSAGGQYYVKYLTIYAIDQDGELVCLPYAPGYDDDPKNPYEMVKKGSNSAGKAPHSIPMCRRDYQAQPHRKVENENAHSVTRLRPLVESANAMRANKLSIDCPLKKSFR